MGSVHGSMLLLKAVIYCSNSYDYFNKFSHVMILQNIERFFQDQLLKYLNFIMGPAT